MESKEVSTGSEGVSGVKEKSPLFQIALFLPVILIMSGDLGVIVANASLIIDDLGWTAVEINIVIGIQYLFQGTFTFIFGYLSDKLPRKWLLIGGGFLWVFGTFLTGFSWDFPSMIFFRIITSIGLGVQSPVTFSMLSDLFPSQKRSNSFAWWGIANLLGTLAVAGLAFSSHDLSQSWLWRQPFMIIAILGLVLTSLIFLVKEPKRAAKEEALKEILLDEEIDYSKQYKIRKEDLQYVIKRKTNIFLVLNFFDNVVSGVLVANLLLYLEGEIRINLAQFDAGLMVMIIGLIIGLGIALYGQFFFAKLGDKKYKGGDLRGRIKVMVYCGLFQIPFIFGALMITPQFPTALDPHSTIFMGQVEVETAVFYGFLILMLVLIGFGMAGSFGGTPNWYASLIDGNLPEQRGTMIAIASLMDTIGRALGTFVAAFLFGLFTYKDSPQITQNFPYSFMLITVGAVFGVLSTVMSIPSLLTCEKDFSEVLSILDQRAIELSEKQKK